MTGWTYQAVRNALARGNDEFVLRSLVLLTNRQTADERTDRTTKYRNGRGFNYNDAAVLTDFGKLAQAGRRLNADAMREIRGRLPKYAGQVWGVMQVAAFAPDKLDEECPVAAPVIDPQAVTPTNWNGITNVPGRPFTMQRIASPVRW